MSTVKEIALRDSSFQPGSTLCTGCMESIAFNNIGKINDNGIKTIQAMGTFCGEVSTLCYPNVVAWGRGEKVQPEFSKSFSVMHNVFESAPTVAEAIRDIGDLLNETGAMKEKVQCMSVSGDGGALAIGLRTLLHTINRRSRIISVVIINEVFANTGFQYSPAANVGTETSTTPVGSDGMGNHYEPLDYIMLSMAAGAGLVAQVNPAFPKYFVKVMEKALECQETAVIFIPGPCISGWKFEEGMAMELAKSGCETGFFPTFMKEKGQKGEVKFCARDPQERKSILDFMGPQRRFGHLVVQDKETGTYKVRPGKEELIKKVQSSIDARVERLYRLADLDI